MYHVWHRSANELRHAEIACGLAAVARELVLSALEPEAGIYTPVRNERLLVPLGDAGSPSPGLSLIGDPRVVTGARTQMCKSLIRQLFSFFEI